LPDIIERVHVAVVSNDLETPRPATPIPSGWIVAVVLLVLTCCLWLPFGLNISCWADGRVVFVVPDQGVFRILWKEARPFLFIPWWFGYILHPQDFTGINLGLLIFIWAKGVVAYLILREIQLPLTLALAGAALVVVYPADNHIFYLGAFAIHFALLCFLAAVYFLLLYWRTSRWSFLVLMWLSLCLSVELYEASYPLILLAPALLWIFRGSLRRLILTSILWYMIPTLGALRLLIVALRLPENMRYQAMLAKDTGTVQDMLSGLALAYLNSFFAGWVRNFGVTYQRHIYVAVAVGATAVAVVWWFARRGDDFIITKRVRRYYQVVALGAFAAVGLGFLMYLPTSLRSSASRTLYFSSVGAAICLAIVVWLLSSLVPFRRLVFAACIGLTIGFATLRLLNAHGEHARRANVQNAVLLETVTAVPQIKPGSMILLIDESPARYLSKAFISSFYFDPPVQTAFHDYSLKAAICYPNRKDPWGDAFLERCIFEDEHVSIYLGLISEQPYSQSRYEKLVVLRFTAEGKVLVDPDIQHYTQSPTALAAYHPSALFDSNGGPPERAYPLFNIIPGLPSR